MACACNFEPGNLGWLQLNVSACITRVPWEGEPAVQGDHSKKAVIRHLGSEENLVGQEGQEGQVGQGDPGNQFGQEDIRVG